MHERNVFLTLTYDDANVPLTLVPDDLSGFVKRLRGRVGSFRFFGCGEYGDRFGRPHYHALLFGAEVSRDVRLPGGAYESEVVADCWKMGKHYADEVTPASAAYCAGYVAKKFGAVGRGEERAVWDPESGELVEWQRPFARMSNRPGLGVPFLEKYGRDLLRGFAVRDGRKLPLPRYYREWLEARYPDRVLELRRGLTKVMQKRERSEFWYGEDSPRRMVAREKHAELTRAFFHPE